MQAIAIPETWETDGIINLTEKEYRLISDLVYQRFGINLTDKKKALIRGRLNSLLKSKGFVSFEEYYEYVINDSSGSSLLSLIDRISTNHSYFFREAEHFDFLTDVVMPELVRSAERRGKREIRIWCAGCAAGEEPYTLAMVLKEFFGADLVRWDVGILATDISGSALTQAEDGIYPEHRLNGVPDDYQKYFRRHGSNSFAVDEKLKSLILFKRLNFMRKSFPFKNKFDVVFCRNVMIYFDQKTRKELIAKFQSHLRKGSYLFIGHSETLGRDTELFQYIKPTVYKKWTK